MQQTTKTPKASATLDCRKLYMGGGGKKLLAILLLFFITTNTIKDYVNIRIMGFDKDKNVNVELISITGAHIANLYSGTVNDKENKKIALPDLSSGLYYVRILSESKALSTQKLTIQ